MITSGCSCTLIMCSLQRQAIFQNTSLKWFELAMQGRFSFSMTSNERSAVPNDL